MDLRIARLVVLVHAGIHAAAAADAARNIQRVGELDAGDRAGVGDVTLAAVLFFVLALHLGDARLQLVFGHFVEALGTAGGENHARGRAGGGFGEQAAALP